MTSGGNRNPVKADDSWLDGATRPWCFIGASSPPALDQPTQQCRLLSRWQRKRSAAGGRVGGVCFSGLGICGGQGPERIGEPEIGRDGLFLLTGAWPPVRIDPVALPGVRQFTQLGDGDRPAGSPGTELAADVLFRPEEIHRASSDDDIVPPSNGWDEAMEPQAFIVRLLIAPLHRDRLTTVGARRVDATVDIERSADTERVPRTVRVPALLRWRMACRRARMPG
jgi:hypothetical protein